MEFKKILIAVDDSTNAMGAAKLGFALAHNLSSEVGLIYVVDRSREIVNADLGITPEQSRTVLLDEAEKTIEQLIRTHQNVDGIVRFTPEGSPEKEILHIAREWGADLIVMDAHEKSGLARLLSGSVTSYVIKHSAIPVMVVPEAKP